MQEIPYFGIRTKRVEAAEGTAQIVTQAAAWAEDAGVQIDDRLLAINNEPLTTEGLGIHSPLRLKLRAGQIAMLTVQRGADVLQVPLRLPSWRRVVEIQGVDVGPPPGWRTERAN